MLISVTEEPIINAEFAIVATAAEKGMFKFMMRVDCLASGGMDEQLQDGFHQLSHLKAILLFEVHNDMSHNFSSEKPMQEFSG